MPEAPSLARTGGTPPVLDSCVADPYPYRWGCTGTRYATGQYPFTATGGGCAREPSGVWTGLASVSRLVDPGFLCRGGATATDRWPFRKFPAMARSRTQGRRPRRRKPRRRASAIRPSSGQMVVTAHVAVAHGIAPGHRPIRLAGLHDDADRRIERDLYRGDCRARAATTLVGETATATGTRPTAPATQEGNPRSAWVSGASITMYPDLSATNPYGALA